MAKVDLYNYPQRLKYSLENMKKDKSVNKENKIDIVSFSKSRLARGSSHGRVAKVVYCLHRLAKWFRKSFRKADKEDLIKLVGELETTNYAEWTKYEYKIVLKMYYKWLLGNDEEFPKIIKWMVPKMKNEKSKLPEELISQEEVLKMSSSAEILRDKAFVLVLYESGCRIGEILTIQLKNVRFDQYGAIIRVSGKTGDRRIRLISSASILASWVNTHPGSDDPEAMVWCQLANSARNTRLCIGHRSVLSVIKRLARKAGIKKRIYPHLFRHSRATALASKLTEAQMKEFFGWVKDSDMAATYVHLSGRDVDDALLKMEGLIKDENGEEDKIRVKVCQRCKEHNSPISKFCIKCGLPLDEKFMQRIETERKSADNLMNKLMEDKEFKDIMMRKISEMGLGKNMI